MARRFSLSVFAALSILSDLTMKDEEFYGIRKTRYIYTTYKINMFFSRQIIQPSIPLIVHAFEILVLFSFTYLILVVSYCII